MARGPVGIEGGDGDGERGCETARGGGRSKGAPDQSLLGAQKEFSILVNVFPILESRSDQYKVAKCSSPLRSFRLNTCRKLNLTFGAFHGETRSV